jgi:hypothetical protein
MDKILRTSEFFAYRDVDLSSSAELHPQHCFSPLAGTHQLQ